MILAHTHLIRTKIIPPPRRARTLARPRVSAALRQALDYRLTMGASLVLYGQYEQAGDWLNRAAIGC